jgi:hypothetical protein
MGGARRRGEAGCSGAGLGVNVLRKRVRGDKERWPSSDGPDRVERRVLWRYSSDNYCQHVAIGRRCQ